LVLPLGKGVPPRTRTKLLGREGKGALMGAFARRLSAISNGEGGKINISRRPREDGSQDETFASWPVEKKLEKRGKDRRRVKNWGSCHNLAFPNKKKSSWGQH